MKNALLLFSVFLVIACKKESASNEPANDPVQIDAVVLGKGTFQNGPYGRVSGIAKVVRNANNTHDLVLDSFQTNNGPDLYVYLSAEVMPVTFIEAGKLKSTGGTQVYALAVAPDLSQYKYVAIHCKAFNHLFGYAPLQ
jgi:hypothetical protein